MIVALIVACEIGFWVCIALGLISRYILRKPRLSTGLLLAAPIVDIILLVATAIDLNSGTPATGAHGLAAIYLGFSIAYGHRMIAWADAHFAYRFADGPKPQTLTGMAYAIKCWKDVLRTGLATGISAAIVWGLTVVATDPSSAASLSGTYRILGLIFAIDFIWAASYTIWPKAAATKTAR